MKIKRATAIYSGGNIYLYYAELEDGNWIMGCDYGLIIIDANPLENETIFEESGYFEWQHDHTVEEISDGKHQEILNLILETIFTGNTIKEYDNFSIPDLESRYKKIEEEIDVWFNIDKFMEYMKEEFPEPMKTHFTCDLLQNVIEYLMNEFEDNAYLVRQICEIVPEITEEEILKFCAK